MYKIFEKYLRRIWHYYNNGDWEYCDRNAWVIVRYFQIDQTESTVGRTARAPRSIPYSSVHPIHVRALLAHVRSLFVLLTNWSYLRIRKIRDAMRLRLRLRLRLPFEPKACQHIVSADAFVNWSRSPKRSRSRSWNWSWSSALFAVRLGAFWMRHNLS